MCLAVSYCFFFFQAEDGIRDLTVTGVQTCALPISFQPEMEDPSNILPDSKKSSSMVEDGMVRCCSLPRVSAKRRSTYFASLSLISCRTFCLDIVKTPIM